MEYIEMLEEIQKLMKGLLDETNAALDDLKTLEENYFFVANKTNSLHTSCQQLIEEQVSGTWNMAWDMRWMLRCNTCYFLKK